MFQDLRFGLRMLLKSPGFTAAAILSLTIGIGATSAIFSVVNGVVLRPLPYKQPEQLVRLWHNKPEIKMTRMPVSGGNVNIWREQAHSFESVAAFSQTASVITGEAEPEQVQGARVSYNLLPMLGYQPLIGRGFLLVGTVVGTAGGTAGARRTTARRRARRCSNGRPVGSRIRGDSPRSRVWPAGPQAPPGRCRPGRRARRERQPRTPPGRVPLGR